VLLPGALPRRSAEAIAARRVQGAGGVSPESSASVERAGRTGLGLHPIITTGSPSRSSSRPPRGDSAGRAPGPIVVGSTAPSPENPVRRHARPLSGSVDQLKDDLHRLVDLGIDHVCGTPTGSCPMRPSSGCWNG